MGVVKILKVMVLFAICGLVLVGCTRKPKIDLSGIRNNPAQLGADVDDDDDWLTGGMADGDDTLNMGSWGGLDEAVAGAKGSAADFLVNPQRWNDVVYFGYDRSELSASERPKVEALAAYLQSNAGTGVVIEGHCDERGSDEYNRALSERRALAVFTYLQSLGIEDARMITVSYGEDRPVIQNAQTENEHGQNRRAEFLFGAMK